MAEDVQGRGGDGASRDRILEAATQLFVQDGYKSTSVKAIAGQVGITPPALYWHFSSKQDLFLAAMEGLLDSFVLSVHDSVTAEDPTEKLRQFVKAHVLWKLEQSDASGAYTSSIGMRDLVHSLPAKHRRALVAKQRRHLNLLRGILQDGTRIGVFSVADSRITAFAIITMCEYVQSWYDPEGELSAEDVGDCFSELVLSMVNAGRPDNSTKPVA